MPKIGLLLNCRGPGDAWRVGRLGPLVDQLLRRPQTGLVLLGDRRIRLGARPRVRNLTGRLGRAQQIAALGKCDLAICVEDQSARAAPAGVPLLVLCFTHEPAFNVGAYDHPCTVLYANAECCPCGGKGCEKPRCLGLIGPATVAREAGALLDKEAPQAQVVRRVGAGMRPLQRPFLSVIVPAVHTHRDHLLCTQRCLAALGSNSAWPHEVILAEGGSAPELAEEARKLRADRHVRPGGGSHSLGETLRVAVASAAGDVLVFLHNDQFVEPGWEETMVRPALSGKVVCGTELRRWGPRGATRALAEEGGTFLDFGGLSLRLATYNRAGGFREAPTGDLSADLCGRLRALGFELRWLSEAPLRHLGGVTRGRRGGESGQREGSALGPVPRAALQSTRLLGTEEGTSTPRRAPLVAAGEFSQVAKRRSPVQGIEPTGAPTYSVSVVVLNQLEMTRDCLESVLRYSRDAEILVTDNGSGAEMREYLRELAAANRHVAVIRNETNQGFLRPQNYAACLAQGEYFCVLNNDTVVGSGWLERLRRALDSDPRVAVVGPLLSRLDQRGVGAVTVREWADYVSGCCLLMRRADLATQGLFDESFEMFYCEDADLSLRLRQAGYLIKQVELPGFRHRHAATARQAQFKPLAREYEARNRAVLLARWAAYLDGNRRFAHEAHLTQREQQGGEKVAVCRQGARGDVLLTTPLLRAIKQESPGCHLTYCTDPAHLEMVEYNPFVDAVMAGYPRAEDFDRVISLDGAYERHPLRSRVAAARLFGEAGGFAVQATRPVFEIGEDDQRAAAALLADLPAQPLVALGLHAIRAPERCWFDERWQELADWVADLGYRVVTLGAPRERGLAGAHVTNLMGKGSFPVLAGALDYCRLVVSVDTVWVHVAAARGVPVVGLFGCAAPELRLPEGESWIGLQAQVPCSPCFSRCHNHRACMAALATEAVYEQVVRMLRAAEQGQAIRAEVVRVPVPA